ncbi:hypothetical protein D1BOALGB6SA_4763 [Olavius sp. associated proteobacterium Delta 1]|nr:hypothetical protein D1BOALGB6SA_4763 [Olavius sp. associated proteobacterium Delta 1]
MTAKQIINDGKKNYDKIGGWLIICAIGLTLYPVQAAVSLYTEIIPAWSSESWPQLTIPGSVSYHPFWAPLLIAELVGNGCFLILSICVVVFFFKQRKFVPRLAIIFLASNFIFVGLDCYFTQSILATTDPTNMGPIINFVRTLVASTIWITYFLFSQRVKRTFTR